jgi:hypothetical protein
MQMMQHARTRFPGLDLQRDTVAVALAEDTGHPTDMEGNVKRVGSPGRSRNYEHH